MENENRKFRFIVKKTLVQKEVPGLKIFKQPETVTKTFYYYYFKGIELNLPKSLFQLFSNTFCPFSNILGKYFRKLFGQRNPLVTVRSSCIYIDKNIEKIHSRKL